MPRFNNDTRKERLKELVKKAQNGEEITKRDFEIAVGKVFSKLYKQRWAEQKDLRDIEVPSEVKEYQAILQEALMMYGRYEQYSPDKRSKTNTIVDRFKVVEELGNKAESLFEDAMTRLEEIITADQSLRIWFDRDIDFSFDTDLSFGFEGMPRVITSKSPENLGQDKLKVIYGWKTKAELKLEMLYEAIGELDKEDLSDSDKQALLLKEQADSQKLKTMLAKLRK
jgi:hypothetical protein